jgi:hypothetical protein
MIVAAISFTFFFLGSTGSLLKSLLILFSFTISKMVWGIFELNLTSFLEADMISLLFSLGYVIIRLAGIFVPLVNYSFYMAFGLSPQILIGLSTACAALVIMFGLERLPNFDPKEIMNRSRNF